MKDQFRDATLGQLVRVLDRKALAYPEELPDFRLPSSYSPGTQEKEKGPITDSVMPVDLDDYELPEPSPGPDGEAQPSSYYILHPFTSRQQYVGEEFSPIATNQTNGVALAPTNTKRMELKPTKTKDGVFLVDWYTTDDPENPQNWSLRKKIWVTFIICIYTFSVYIGSSLYTSSEPDVRRIFGVGSVPASLGLALYVLAYGIGPMLWSPLSEVPAIGRNPPYVATFAVFVILCVPTALVDNFAGLLVLRFLLGFFGSPCLATGGASFGDMWSPIKMPYVLVFWAGFATLGPALGPVIAGFAVTAEGWRWSSWELLWLSGPILILMFILLPETSHDTILLRRAQRLRKITERTDLKSQSEIKQANQTIAQVCTHALVIPWKINLQDPAVLFSTVYTAIVYAIYYSFFESFPLVYPVLYDFNLGETGLPFLSVFVALIVAASSYIAFFYWYAEPRMKRLPGFGPQEDRLLPGLVATFLVPIGCFLFAWTSRRSVHWIASVFGVGINILGTFTVLQCMFIYLPFTYPQYSASLFAANDLARSSLAAGAILFSGPMFINLGVDGGVSLLGGLTIVCIFGIYALWIWGPKLRARSKFAVA